MVRLWAIWLIASFVIGIVTGLKGWARAGAVTGLACGLVALVFNLVEGDSFVSSFWSMVAAGGGLAGGAIIGGSLMRLFTR